MRRHLMKDSTTRRGIDTALDFTGSLPKKKKQ
jgi:hypothetical protein